MSKTLTVEGDLATVDTRANLTTQGSVTTPSLIVPAGMKKIDKILCAAAADGLAVGSAVFILRIGGSSVARGEQTFVISASGTIAAQAGSDTAPQVGQLFVLDDADVDVSPSDSLTIAGEMAGSDNGTGRMVCTLVFA